MKKIEKVLLIGLGAMGAYFVPGLSETLGKDFRVMAEGARKERLEKNGVTINGKHYPLNIVTPEESGETSDLVIIAVKMYDLDTALSQIKEQVGKNTLIMSVLNGVESEDHVIARYGKERLIYSLMRISIEMENGKADFDPKGGVVDFGDEKNDLNALSENVLAVKELFDRCGIGYVIGKDMIRDLWTKFMGNVGENMTCALLGVPFSAFQRSEYAKEICISAMREVVAVAKAKGIDLNYEDIDKQVARFPMLPSKNRPSTLQDLDRGKLTEVDTFSGAMVKFGKELSVPTPVNELLFRGIKVREERMLGRFD